MVLFKSSPTASPAVLKSVFTFQYGSIQIGPPMTAIMVEMIFTFQYGSIQMMLIIVSIFNLYLFTFQYGSIQIGPPMTAIIVEMIYIPIWFYSNHDPVAPS